VLADKTDIIAGGFMPGGTRKGDLAKFDTAAKITEACTVGRDCAKHRLLPLGSFPGVSSAGNWLQKYWLAVL
jgi:hypothetical protein